VSRSLPLRTSRRRRRRDLRRLAIMEAALLVMPTLRREIFLAVRLDALAYAEVARRTGLSVAAVEREMVRALRALGDALRQDRTPKRRRRPWQSGQRRP